MSNAGSNKPQISNLLSNWGKVLPKAFCPLFLKIMANTEIEQKILDLKNNPTGLTEYLEDLPNRTWIDIKPGFTTLNLYKDGDIWEITSCVEGIEVWKVDSITLADIITGKKYVRDL